jgi:hypothetical protein
MFPKACKCKKVVGTWKFRFIPMFSQAMKHEKTTNVWLGNPSCDHTPCGTTANAHHLKMPLKMFLPEF